MSNIVVASTICCLAAKRKKRNGTIRSVERGKVYYIDALKDMNNIRIQFLLYNFTKKLYILHKHIFTEKHTHQTNNKTKMVTELHD